MLRIFASMLIYSWLIRTCFHSRVRCDLPCSTTYNNMLSMLIKLWDGIWRVRINEGTRAQRYTENQNKYVISQLWWLCLARVNALRILISHNGRVANVRRNLQAKKHTSAPKKKSLFNYTCWNWFLTRIALQICHHKHFALANMASAYFVAGPRQMSGEREKQMWATMTAACCAYIWLQPEKIESIGGIVGMAE